MFCYGVFLDPRMSIPFLFSSPSIHSPIQAARYHHLSMSFLGTDDWSTKATCGAVRSRSWWTHHHWPTTSWVMLGWRAGVKYFFLLSYYFMFFLCFDIFYDVGERNNEFKFAHTLFTLGRKLQISPWLYRFAIIQRVQLYVLIIFKRRETEKWVKILTSIFTFGKVQISHWLYQFAII